MSIKPVLVPDHTADDLRRLMDHFADAASGPSKKQLNESRAAVAAARDALSEGTVKEFTGGYNGGDDDDGNDRYDHSGYGMQNPVANKIARLLKQRQPVFYEFVTGGEPAQIRSISRAGGEVERDPETGSLVGPVVFDIARKTSGGRAYLDQVTITPRDGFSLVAVGNKQVARRTGNPDVGMPDSVKQMRDTFDEGVAEGLKDTIKKGVKNIKRGMQGWDDSDLAITGTENKPRDVANRAKNLSDKDLKDVHRAVNAPGVGIFGKGEYKNPAKHSPAGLQKHVLDREIRKRGLEEQGVAEGSVARGDLYNVVIEYFNGGKGHRNAMALRKKAESGMSAKNLAVLLNDFSKKKWGSTLNGSDAIDAVKNIVYPYDFDQGVAEAYDFKGGFPFDVDHMPGAVYRGGDSPVQSAKKKYSDHQQWEAAVNKMNSRQYDDSSEYTSDSKGQQVTADGHTWAAWNDTKGFGWIEAADMAEGSENFTITHKKDQTWPGSIQVLVTNKNTGDWKVIAGDPKKIRQQLKHEFGIDYNFDQQDMLEGVAEGKKRSDRYHIVGKDGNPASLASYADQASAVKDRDAKHPGAEVRQVGPRGKIKGVAEGSKVKTPKGYGDIVQPQKLKTIAKADLGKNELNLPAGYGDIVQPQKYKTITKAKGVAEGNPDVMRHTGDKTVKVVKRGGKPVGEIGIDSGPEGNGDYYVKLYDGSYDAAGFATAEEALAELKYAIKSAVSGPDTSFGGPGGWTGPVEEQQVDELSPKTLGSYIKKSSADAATRQGEVSGRNQFGKGAEFAVKAFYGDQIQPHPQRNDPKIAKRQAGVDQAVDRLTKEDVAPVFKPGDRVMYAGRFATVVAQDGDAYGIRVDAQPGTMKVLANQIKKPSYDESIEESIDPVEQLRADIRRFAQ